jgi:hypothetical protein
MAVTNDPVLIRGRRLERQVGRLGTSAAFLHRLPHRGEFGRCHSTPESNPKFSATEWAGPRQHERHVPDLHPPLDRPRQTNRGADKPHDPGSMGEPGTDQQSA